MMASHFDYKTKSRGLIFILINEKHKCYWRIIFKVIKSFNFLNYIFVYRKAIPFLLADIASIYFLFSLNLKYIFIFQTLSLIYGFFIKRRGLFFYWKSIFLSSIFLFFPKKRKLKIKFL